MATHSSTLPWKIPWTEEPGRLQSMGSQRVGHDWATSLHYRCGNWITERPKDSKSPTYKPSSFRLPRCKCAFHHRQAWVKLQLALRLLLLMTLQLYHLPAPLPPPVSNFLPFTPCQSLYTSCCTKLLYFSRYCTVRFKMISLFCVFVFYILFMWKVL